jgi:tRNA modification GTPase
VVRVSGPLAAELARAILGTVPLPRLATYRRFCGARGEVLDEGIAIFFASPRSYTGEDILELQGHGGPVVLREILARCVELGARLAEPGEFTRRAFLNERLDLAQAESVADLIEASSAEAVRSAARSLSGEFSRRIHRLVADVTELRMHVEACIDFPEEDIDAADRAALRERLAGARKSVADLLEEARQGAVLREGLTVVLVGAPNVGKSSLLNRLAGEDLAIVTPIAGTTRDHVRATIALEGVPIHLIDTAGLRESRDEVERIGIDRTWSAIAQAGAALVISDATTSSLGKEEAGILSKMPRGLPLARVENKIDLCGLPPGREDRDDVVTIRLSAKNGDGVELLRGWLLEVAGWRPHGEGIFMARERHLLALRDAAASLARAAEENLQVYELFAEDLRMTQNSLGTITGAVSADDLLGEIFGRFCIGK